MSCSCADQQTPLKCRSPFTILSSRKNKNYECDSTEREIKALFLILIVDTEDFSNSLESYFTQSK